jgi:hypothetical protein
MTSGAGTELARDQVKTVLRLAGYEELAELAGSSLPDPVERVRVLDFLELHGVFYDDLISRFGGSP